MTAALAAGPWRICGDRVQRQDPPLLGLGVGPIAWFNLLPLEVGVGETSAHTILGKVA